jgi:hypothetical protein
VKLNKLTLERKYKKRNIQSTPFNRENIKSSKKKTRGVYENLSFFDFLKT